MSVQLKITDSEALKSVEAWHKLQEDFKTQIAVIRHRADQEMTTLYNSFNTSARDYFRNIADKYDTPGDAYEHFKTGAWYVDFTFWAKHGDVFLCQANSPIAETPEETLNKADTEKFIIQ